MKVSYNYIEDYLNDVKKNKLPLGDSEKKAIERYKKLKKDDRYYLDLEEVRRIVEIAGNLTLVKNGRVEKFKLRGFQKFILGNLVGWKVKETGNRLYREAYIQIGRQNGKTLLNAALIIYFSCFCKYHNSRIFCAATKKDQAKLVWNDVATFIRANKILDKKYYKIQEHASTITAKNTNCKIIALSKDTKSLDGFDSVLGIIDEYHAHTNDQMYKLLQDGQVNVSNALIVAITTAGFNLNSPCFTQYNYAKSVLDDIITQDSLFIFIAEPNKNDKIDKISTWKKANPFLFYDNEYNLLDEKVNKYKDSLKSAQKKGGAELLNFMTKKLNIWVQSTDNDYLNVESIKKSKANIDFKDIKGKKAILGIDLSSGGDLTSVSFVILLDDNKKYVHSMSFIPEETLNERVIKSQLPYNIWVKKGYLRVTNGFKTNYKDVLSYIKEFIKENELELLETGYDRYGAGAWLEDLTEIVEQATDVVQSARNLGSTVEDFKLSFDNNEILIDENNELFLWSLMNAKVVYNSFGEPKVIKERIGDKIDPVISSINAWYMYFNNKLENVDVNNEFDKWLESME